MLSSDNVIFKGVLSSEIDLVWNEIIPYLEKTLEYADDKYSIEDIYNIIKNQEMQLWVAFENSQLILFVITQILIYPQKKVLSLPFAGGVNREKWIHHIETLAAYARENDCKSVEGYIRPGWEKVLKKYGFKPIYSIIKANI